MAYTDLSDEGKLNTAIKFVATGQPLPKTLLEFLREADLYELIVSPNEFEVQDASSIISSPDK